MTFANSQNETLSQTFSVSIAPNNSVAIVAAETTAANDTYVVGGDELDKFDDDMEYVIDVALSEQNSNKLDAMFEDVKQTAKGLKKQEIATTNHEHLYLAKLSVFAIESLKDEGYLEKYYMGITKDNKKFRYKKVVDYGYNFGPLLNQSWYDKGNMPLNKANRLSRAMNTLIKMHKADPTMQTDTVDRFMQILQSEGGLGKLVTYKNSAANAEAGDEVGDIKMDVHLVKTKGFTKTPEQLKELAKKGVSHFACKTGLPAIQINHQVPVNEDSLSLWVVKQGANNDFELITATDKSNEIQKLMAKSYASDFGLLDPHVRVLAETIATQCLPASHQQIYTKLLEQADKNAGGQEKLAVRRVIYKEQTGEFLMSAIRLSSSVVTIATPKERVFDTVDHDLFLVTPSRRKFETEIVNKRNFASHTVSSEDMKTPISINHHGCVAINLNEIGNKLGSFKLLFVPEQTTCESLYQVDIDRNQLNASLWSCEVGTGWFKYLSDTFTSKWLESHGEHMNRDHQEVIEVKFQKTYMEIGFYKEGKTFAHKVQIKTFADAIGTKAFKSCFLSKDFAVAFQALGDMSITSNPVIELHEGMLSISYETDAAKYELFIPRCDYIGNRNVTGYKTYALSPMAEDPNIFETEYTQEEIVKDFE
jgi:hypothetical protein